jgi:hypothetical protein
MVRYGQLVGRFFRIGDDREHALIKDSSEGMILTEIIVCHLSFDQ